MSRPRRSERGKARALWAWPDAELATEHTAAVAAIGDERLTNLQRAKAMLRANQCQRLLKLRAAGEPMPRGRMRDFFRIDSEWRGNQA